MRTSYRDVFLLACCQALLLVNTSGLVLMTGLVGFSLVDAKGLATLGATTFVIGSALSTMPASLWMARVGRRTGFMAGALINVGGCVLAAFALSIHSFALFCLATAVIGVYSAFGLQYRFAAAEVAAPHERAKAISLVLAGGVAGGFLGPELTRATKDLLPTPFLGAFIALAAAALIALAVQSRLHVPPPSAAESSGDGRPLREIVRQPVFIVAAMSAAIGYGLMNLLMVATPLAMSMCGHGYGQTAQVFEWHIAAMYAPGFFTGTLIQRFGTLRIIGIGIVMMVIAAAVALNGNTVPHFVAALALLGGGWNFMYIGGTTLLTQAYTPPEKARTQGANDFIVFATMGLSSFSGGFLVHSAGWEAMNVAALPVLAVVAVAVGWLAWQRRASRPLAA